MIWEIPLYLQITITVATILALWIIARTDPYFAIHPGWCILIAIASAAQISVPLSIAMLILMFIPGIWSWVLGALGFLGCYLGLVKLTVAKLI